MLVFVNGTPVFIQLRDQNKKVFSKLKFAEIVARIIKEVDPNNEKCASTNPLGIEILNRPKAAKLNAALSEKNKNIIDKIAKSAFVFNFDSAKPSSQSESVKEFIHGNPFNRVHNKGVNVIWTKNGYSGVYCCHAMSEGIMPVIAFSECAKHTVFRKEKEVEVDNNVDLPDYEIQEFEKLDDDSNAVIESGLKDFETGFRDKLDVRLAEIKLGKKDLRPFKLHPDNLMQLAIQLAFYTEFTKFYCF